MYMYAQLETHISKHTCIPIQSNFSLRYTHIFMYINTNIHWKAHTHVQTNKEAKKKRKREWRKKIIKRSNQIN